jgi:2,4-dienoyl-CoA reductase-like NADH-dependent reductase (Old Yellow Enzyme family)
MTSPLFQPLALRQLTLPNRVVVSPMCQYSAVDGNANDWHLMHLGALTQGNAGLTLLEATAVSPQGRITPGCLGLYSDANEAALARLLVGLCPHATGPIGMQVGHAGRKASSQVPWQGGQLIAQANGGWQPCAPSALSQRPEEPAPKEMSLTDIEEVLAQFVTTTQRAARLGLDALELHSAHGYLLHEFLSPVSNQRQDAYGGSLENRMRFPLQVFDAMRAAWPAEKPLGVRVSASDWLEHLDTPSWRLEDTIAFTHALKARGCDWIDVSSAGISPQQRIALKPGYQAHFAKAVRRATGMPTMAVGLITDPHQAEALIADGDADMVALARGFLWNPRWVWHAAATLGVALAPPPQFGRGAPREHADVFATAHFGQR